MFAPVAFVHPLRVVRLRGLTIAVTLAWFAFAAIAIFENLSPPGWVVGGLVLTAAYSRPAAAEAFALGARLNRSGRFKPPCRIGKSLL